MRNKKIRNLVMTALLSAVAFVLMFLEFPVPAIIPDFIKVDFSELPALIATFSLGPVWGVLVCLIKNLLHLLIPNFATPVGELANFLLGATFTFTAGIIYKNKRTLKGALTASLIGSLAMAVLSFPINYFITYPFYSNLMPMQAIIGAYKVIMPSIDSLWEALLIFNVPFNFVFKGIATSLLTFLLYKRISPIIKGR